MNYFLPQDLEHFNFDHEEVEKNVLSGKENYKDLSFEALYTCREDFLSLFSSPEIQGTFVDLGCGTGEGCLLYGSIFPDRKAIGVEFEKARLEVGERFKFSNVELIHADLLEVVIPEGDTYFMYFPTGLVLDRILKVLYESGKDFRLAVIESHGDFYNRLDLENWLEVISEIPLKSPRHQSHARIYKRNNEIRSPDLAPFDLSFRREFLLIEDAEESWIGESYGLQWLRGNDFELHIPPRTISWNQVARILSQDELQNYTLALSLRPQGELTFNTVDRSFKGHIRKIIITPTFRLELSTGEKVGWSEVTSIFKDNELCYALS